MKHRTDSRVSKPGAESSSVSGVSRRGFLASGTAAVLSTIFPTGRSWSHGSAAEASSSLLGFENVRATSADTVTLPRGYRWQRLISWGDPLFPNAPEFDPSGNAPASHQLRQFGDNNDGIGLFPLDNGRVLLVVNHEFTTHGRLLGNTGRKLGADDVLKAQYAHGVSIMEVSRSSNGEWKPVLDSPLNRRLHVNSPARMSGPAAGHDLLRTPADPSGYLAMGTLANCACGLTPWGTFLTCEENFHYYFDTREPLSLTADHARYQIRSGRSFYGWHLFNERFDLGLHSNECHRFGWVVELDPTNPGSVPRKRTALGRIMHENAALHVNNDGRVVVYMGDDAAGEHLYRFVSRDGFNPHNPRVNMELLDSGTLYVAKFESESGRSSGSGRWIALEHGSNGLTSENGFRDQAEVLVFTRRAATRVGATTLDRPEWVALRPGGREVYCALTRNLERGDPGQPVGGPSPRSPNRYGQILRWRPDDDDHCADAFQWDLYVVAGNPDVFQDENAGSSNVNRDNMFNAPDGLGFDKAGRLWIQTDGDTSNRGEFQGMGNNQMLCGDPTSGEIRRFMVGPTGCEITGLAFSPDHTAMFVGIQHPGEGGGNSDFPDGGGARPRSSMVVVSRRDGGVIGT